MRTRVLTTTAVAGLVLLAGCGGGAPSDTSAGGTPTPKKRTLTVLAAASLTDTFGELEKQFETDNPGVDVVMSYGGSSDLAQQIVNGAPVDVFASASDSTMKTVTDAGLTNGSPTIFAKNVLEIATVPGNPKGITFPESGSAVNTYPIAPVDGSDETDLAQEFVDLVLSDTGQKILSAAGFGQP